MLFVFFVPFADLTKLLNKRTNSGESKSYGRDSEGPTYFVDIA